MIAGFLAGRKREYQTISSWISRVVKLNSWGLEEYSDDITQDVLLRLYGNLEEKKFRFASDLKTYVCRIAKFTCVEYLRKQSSRRKRESPLTEIPSNDNPERDLVRKEEGKTLWRIYRLMSAECRQLWRMVFWESLSYLQIAERLGIKEGTVKSRFARCKGKAIRLRRKLTKKGQLFRLSYDHNYGVEKTRRIERR
jgi:RNA polymerase sigma-70 factor (ECF subfamily)